MTIRWWWWVGLGIAGLVLVGRSSPPSAEIEIPRSQRRAAIVATGQQLGLPPTWIDWLVWVARGESGWSIQAHNDSPSESSASGRAYDRLVREARWPCEQTRSRYAIGSGGWYGQLAPFTIVFAVQMGMGCDPIAIWRHPVQSTLTHLRQVRGTLATLRAKTGGAGTFLQLRALYGVPSRDPATVDTPNRRAAYTRTLTRAGIDPAMLDAIVPPLEVA